MGSCNEEDFLERLGPQLRWKIRAQRRFCPDAETLSAVLEGTAPGPVCEQVIKHLRHCAQCAALETRLRAFDEVTMPESAVEWTQARARLDNWLDGFLRSERAARAQKEGRSLWGVLTWETVSKFLLPGKLKWALGATVVVLMLIPSALLLRLRHEQLLENQAALRQAIPQQQPASPPAGTPAEAPPRESQKGGQTTVTAPQGKHAATPTSSPETTAPSSPQGQNLPTLTAEARQSPPPATGETAQPAPATPATAVGRGASGALTGPATGLRPGAGLTAVISGGSYPPRIFVGNGQEASLGPGGRIVEIRDRNHGMVVECGLHPAERTVVTESNGLRVVSLGPHHGYLERPFINRNERTYFRRTYLVDGRSFAQVYQADYYQGVRYYSYVPAYYYHPAFYHWAYSPWPAPVNYRWKWYGAPWYTSYGTYFAPASAYLSAPLWLTDFLIAEDLRLAYEAAQNHRPDEQPAEAGSTAAAQLTPEVKAAVEAEVKRLLAAEQVEASLPTTASGSMPTAGSAAAPAALDPARRLFVVSSDLLASSTGGQECELTGGDVIARIDDTPDQDGKVRTTVLSSKQNECAVGSRPKFEVNDLQEMQNSFRVQLDRGLSALAESQGKNGLPPAPDTAATAGEIPPPAPDPNVEMMLQNAQNEATQLEAEVQQEIQSTEAASERANGQRIGVAVPSVPGAGQTAAAASGATSKRPGKPVIPGVSKRQAARKVPTAHSAPAPRPGRMVPLKPPTHAVPPPHL
ncbi:MAG: hypothetical protein ABSH52_10015 [Terriglobia bacterium]